MIKKIYAKLKADGIRGFITVVFRRIFPRHLACARRIKPLIHDKIGLEIGGPSGIFKQNGLLPLYRRAARIDNCNFGRYTVWENTIKEGATFHYDKRRAPGNQYICEATDLHQLASGSYDFILSSHTLEHTANPVKALMEWVRILKGEGLLVMILPHKDGTFDHRRPVTSLAHLVQDFDQKVGEDDLTHLDEILKLHDLAKDPWAGGFESFKERSGNNLENRCLHHHVFDTRLAIEVIHHIGLQVLFVEAFHPYNILVIAQKPGRDGEVQNDDFRGLAKPPVWRSPFPSDQPLNH
jgi:SAM-dependent methyltransferase